MQPVVLFLFLTKFPGKCCRHNFGRVVTCFRFIGFALCTTTSHVDRRYAAGATVQIILFGILAVEVKRKAPK